MHGIIHGAGPAGTLLLYVYPVQPLLYLDLALQETAQASDILPEFKTTITPDQEMDLAAKVVIQTAIPMEAVVILVVHPITMVDAETVVSLMTFLAEAIITQAEASTRAAATAVLVTTEVLVVVTVHLAALVLQVAQAVVEAEAEDQVVVQVAAETNQFILSEFYFNTA